MADSVRRSTGATRDRVLVATVALLAERGTTGTGLNQVVEESGVSYGSVYHQFRGGKNALITAAVERAGAEIERALTAVLDDADSLAAGCATMFDYAASMLTASDFRSGCPVGTAVGDGHSVLAVRTASADAFARWTALIVERAVDFGASRRNAEHFASTVVSIYEGSLLVARASHSIAPIDAARAVAVEFAERISG